MELVRRLAAHPNVELTACYCQTPRSWEKAAPHLNGLKLPPLKALSELTPTEIMFFCLPHGQTAASVAKVYDQAELLVDLSADFRLADSEAYKKHYDFAHPAPQLLKYATYALAERVDWAKEENKLLAVPGCYPTATLLPLLPLLEAEAVATDGIIVNALSGLSGAGRSPKEELLFCENAESVRAYAVGNHRHLAEINHRLGEVAAGVGVIFTPHLVPMNRGLYATITARRLKGEPMEVLAAAYRDSAFVHLVGEPPTTAQVKGTNHCRISVKVVGESVVITSAIDNLVKGAAGQALQAMNLRLGLAETAALGESGRAP